MDLLKLFSRDIMDQAIDLYVQNTIVMILKEEDKIEALVYDDYFYKVELTFNKDLTIIWPRVSRDGFRDVCPFSSPYAAAVLYALYMNREYGITCAFNLKAPLHIDDDAFINNKDLVNMQCYHRLLSDLTKHILRIQNYNTDAKLATFSDSIDDLFEYFDSIHEAKERLVALQLFLHIYKHLTFNFNSNFDIDSLIIDEANMRIHQILQFEMHPFNRNYYHSLLLNDNQIASMLSNYNKSSTISH